MPTVEVDGTPIAYELIGAPGAGTTAGTGATWVITPGGRFSKDVPGIKELALELADAGHRVLVWDRPNTGASGVRFTGDSESAMQADLLSGLIADLGLPPVVVAGGSGGARVSLLLAARHPNAVSKLAIWWISGGVFGLMTLGIVYCGESIRAAWQDGMEAVVALPEWAEVLERNPSNRERFLKLDPQGFIEVMQRWMTVYCPDETAVVPGLPDDECRGIAIPTLVFRSGRSDPYHTRSTSETLASLLPASRLVEPPWGDREWIEVAAAARAGTGHLFERWPLLAPQLLEFAAE